MMKIGYFIVFLISIATFGQKKVSFERFSSVLAGIKPNEAINFWSLHLVDGNSDKVLLENGEKVGTEKQKSGFLADSTRNTFYYICYQKGNKLTYVTTNDTLKQFISKTDNAEEAMVLAVLQGYYFDEEYKQFAGNYYEDSQNYYLDLAKITSENCPLAKSFFMITVDKKSGNTISVKDNGVYTEVYSKECKNNPKNPPVQIKKQEEKPKKKTYF